MQQKEASGRATIDKRSGQRDRSHRAATDKQMEADRRLPLRRNRPMLIVASLLLLIWLVFLVVAALLG